MSISLGFFNSQARREERIASPTSVREGDIDRIERTSEWSTAMTELSLKDFDLEKLVEELEFFHSTHWPNDFQVHDALVFRKKVDRISTTEEYDIFGILVEIENERSGKVTHYPSRCIHYQDLLNQFLSGEGEVSVLIHGYSKLDNNFKGVQEVGGNYNGVIY